MKKKFQHFFSGKSGQNCKGSFLRRVCGLHVSTRSTADPDSRRRGKKGASDAKTSNEEGKQILDMIMPNRVKQVISSTFLLDPCEFECAFDTRFHSIGRTYF